MAQRSQPVVSETEVIVRERTVHIKFLLSSHSYLQFVLSPRIRDYLPIMHAILERPVTDDRAEVVVGLAEEQVAEVG